MRVFLLRHGETDWNAERRIQGQVDIPGRGLESILNAHRRDDEILIVAHGGSVKAALSYGLGLSIDETRALPTPGNAALMVLEGGKGAWSLRPGAVTSESMPAPYAEF